MHGGLPLQNDAEDWIGIFDSGLGGLAVAREVLRLLPAERLYYFGDTLHIPYGSRSMDDIRALSTRIAGNLLRLPAKVVVVACNTASAAALAHLRRLHPGRLFVGMEPAVKPAALNSRTRRVGVLATPATFEGEPFKKLRAMFSAEAEIFSQPCPGLADAIERCGPGHPEVESLLGRFIAPLLPERIDHLVLGCTHYSLVAETIQRIAGDGVSVVDPSPAVARRVRQVLAEAGLLREGGEGRLVLRASGDPDAFSRGASLHLARPVRADRAEFSLDVFSHENSL